MTITSGRGSGRKSGVTSTARRVRVLAAARYGHVCDKRATRCVYSRLTGAMSGLNDHEKKINMIGQ